MCTSIESEIEKQYQLSVSASAKEQNHLSASASRSETKDQHDLSSECASIESETVDLPEGASPPGETSKSEFEQFRCPCKECDLLSYVVKGCLITSSGSYPYLPLNKLSEADKQDLIQQLDDDAANSINQFASLL